MCFLLHIFYGTSKTNVVFAHVYNLLRIIFVVDDSAESDEKIGFLDIDDPDSHGGFP